MRRKRCRAGANGLAKGWVLALAGAACWGLSPGVAWAQLSPSEPEGVRPSWQFWAPAEEDADADVTPAPAAPVRRAPAPATATPRSVPARATSELPTAAAPATRSPVVVAAGDDEVEYVFDEEAGNPLLNFLHERVEIGTRVTAFHLKDASRPADPNREETYVGYLNRLDDDQNYAPVKVFADVYVNPYFGAELTYDEVAGRAYNMNGGDSDGYIEMSGPIFSLIGRYPIQDMFYPYVGIGYAWMDATFERAPWWEWGWKSEADYEAAGGGVASTGIYRYMIVEDDDAMVYTIGLVVRFTDHLAADVMVRSMDLKADTLFYRTIDGVVSEPDTSRGAFVMDHIAYGLGVRYVF